MVGADGSADTVRSKEQLLKEMGVAGLLLSQSCQQLRSQEMVDWK